MTPSFPEKFRADPIGNHGAKGEHAMSRRDFVRKTTLAAAAAQLVTSLGAQERSARAPVAKPALAEGVIPVRWLDGKTPRAFSGASWGVPWPRGKMPKTASFGLKSASGKSVPLQSWPLATWPDGSLKWTAHAVPAGVQDAESFQLTAGSTVAPDEPVVVRESGGRIEIGTGVMTVQMNSSGGNLIESIRRNGRSVLTNGRLVLLRRDAPEATAATEEFFGEIEKLEVEQRGPVRAVIRVEGRHRGSSGAGARRWLPFVVRLYFHAGSDAVRVMHTIRFDGDERKDFIGGLGVSFKVPLDAELHDRHVRFSGQDDGLFAEAVRGLTGLRRDPGAAVKEAQLAGRATPEVSSWPQNVRTRLHWIPAWSDWTLFQPNSDGFEIRKRTKEGCTWISAARGERAGGLGYVGSPKGGVAFGVRNFWQSHPAQLDIRDAATDIARVTAWLWAPDAAPMDLRGYHDGMGQDTYEKQLDALEITYEDYEPGFDTPEGVARTSELYLWALDATPARENLAAMAELVRTPPVLVTTPEYIHRCEVFGGMWSPADRSSPARAAIEDQLEWYFDFYQTAREERRWYGFWNYGDVMHSYDADRHEWKYDVGGFAWDNSELSTDIWLWLLYLRSGRADIFRFAEAMTRHTGEVDVHHSGRFAPLGSRHNVLHWGCSAKQLRISTAVNRRYYYFLTGDERVGDLMREQIEAARALATVQANRKVARDRVTKADPNATEVYTGFGTDWGSLAGAWLTEWERTGNPQMRERLVAGMKSIAAQPRGFFTGGARLVLDSGEFRKASDDRANVSHLSAVFGLPEVCAELVQLLDVPEFERAWLDYCVLYNATPEEQAKVFGQPLRGISLQQGHSRLTAFAAKRLNDAALARRAWSEFYRGEGSEGRGRRNRLESRTIKGPAVLRPVEEAVWVSTNGAAQWGLAAIQCLALVGDSMP